MFNYFEVGRAVLEEMLINDFPTFSSDKCFGTEHIYLKLVIKSFQY